MVKRRGKLFKSLILIYSLILLGIASFTAYALKIGNVNALFGGLIRVVSQDTDKPAPPSDRPIIVIDKHSQGVVIQSGYNYIFRGDEDWGTQNNPIDLNQYYIVKGTEQDPLDAYIDGGYNYFKFDLSKEELANGLLGVFSGTLVNLNLYTGSVAQNSEIAIFASSLTQEGIIYNCANYLEIETYEFHGFAAGFVKTVEGVIKKCVNYGDISSSGSASGFAYEVKGSIINCVNYGAMESNSLSAAGIAYKVSGVIDYCQNLGDIYGNHGAAGIVVTIEDGVVQNCVNGIPYGDMTIYASSGVSAGLVCEVKSVNKTSLIQSCVNYANINGHSAYGVAYTVKGNIFDTRNYGNIESYQTCAGIAETVEGCLLSVGNYGNVDSKNLRASGIANSVIGQIIQSVNYGTVTTENGHVSGIVCELQGDVIETLNVGQIRKTGWSYDAYIAGIAVFVEGQIIDSQNIAEIVIDHIARYAGGIAAVLKGKIENSKCSGPIIQNNEYQPVTAGGITAVAEDWEVEGEIILTQIKDCEFSGGFEILSTLAQTHCIAWSYPAGSIINCVGMGEIYNL